ncbi:hypothetical protein Tco_1070889 [Tanacetum coccineum]|uniref:Uncharacterized protein n=1 Tax=Tanacetum coccineum TaxID=301880 RepID=A0ABQ5HPG8_9ASTR
MEVAEQPYAPEKADKAIGKKRVDGEGPSRKKKRKTRPETSSTGASVAWLDALMDQADKQDPPHHEVIYEHAEKNAANADAGNEYGDENFINEGHDDNAKEGFVMRTQLSPANQSGSSFLFLNAALRSLGQVLSILQGCR